MIQIKIISIISNGYDCNEIEFWAARGITDWESVDEDTYKKLCGWVALKNRDTYPDEKYVVITKPDVNIPTCVADFVKFMEEDEKRRAAIKAKAELSKKMKQLKKQKLNEKEEREMFEKLKAKFEGDNKS